MSKAKKALKKLATIVTYEDKDSDFKETMFSDNPEEFKAIYEELEEKEQLEQELEELKETGHTLLLGLNAMPNNMDSREYLNWQYEIGGIIEKFEKLVGDESE